MRDKPLRDAPEPDIGRIKAKSRTPRISLVCIVCGGAFSTTVTHKDARFCGSTCHRRHYRKHGKTRVKGDPRNCIQCGKEFIVTESSRHYVSCSRECSDLNRRGKVLGGSFLPPGSLYEMKGYIYVKGVDGKKRPQHRVVMAEKIGRAIALGELVHHINGNKHDNRPENLQLVLSKREHLRIHFDAESIGLRVQAGELIVLTPEQYLELAAAVHPLEGIEV